MGRKPNEAKSEEHHSEEVSGNGYIPPAPQVVSAEHPSDVHDRIERAMLIIQLTETADRPTTLERAWRMVTGDNQCADQTAVNRANEDKRWFKRKFGMGLVAAMDTRGLGLLDFIDRLKKHLDAPVRDKSGKVVVDPESGEEVPDYKTQHKAFEIYNKLLVLSGFMGLIEAAKAPDDVPVNTGNSEREAAKECRLNLRKRTLETAPASDAS